MKKQKLAIAVKLVGSSIADSFALYAKTEFPKYVPASVLGSFHSFTFVHFENIDSLYKSIKPVFLRS